jgi:DNA-directed RNA polymerase specialized sigma24 family protein
MEIEATHAGVLRAITVEAFWRIYRAHVRLDPARGFEGWARRIATRAALDYLRTQWPEVELPADLNGVPGIAREDADCADCATRIELGGLPSVPEQAPHPGQEVAEPGKVV